MAKKFSDLVAATMSPESITRAKATTKKMREEMPLNELRQARGLSQKALAAVLHVEQPAIAKLERRTDMYLSTLRSHIEAMGGVLEIVAKFPDGAVRIQTFTKLEQRRNIADALAMPGIADIEFEPPRVTIQSRPADFS